MEYLVSVIIPVYNVEKYIERCIFSVLSQTYTNIEIILVDDGSTDNSGNICDEIKKQDNRISVIHKKNGGLSSARNAGIDIARGEYLSFIDSDDYVAQTFIEELLEMVVKHDAQMSQCCYRSVDDRAIPLIPVEEKNEKKYSAKEAVEGCCIGTSYYVMNNTVTWNKIYHRSLFAELRFPIGKIHEDEFLMYQLKWNTNCLVTTERCLYYYYLRDNSITGQFSPKHMDKLEAYRQKEVFLKEQGMEEAYSASLIRRYYATMKFHEGMLADNTQEYNEIRKQIVLQCKALTEEILALENITVRDKYEILSLGFSEDEKRGFRKKYGIEEEDLKKNEVYYKFPCDKIPRYSKIILYGTGKVGTEYYYQLMKNSFYDVIAWVDLTWRECQWIGLKVEAQDRLIQYEYDFVVLATEKKELADEQIRQLKEWKIPERKIVWVTEPLEV